MTFDEILVQVLELLQREGRLSYPALKLRFNLDDTYLDALKAELIDAKRLAADEGGKVLVWTGNPSLESRVQSLESEGQRRDSTVQTLDPRRQTLDAAAERRQLTVMFCDLVGSTTLSERLDPEEYREVVRSYQESCAEVIHRYAGHTAQHLGDGLLVYFGYPAAHEDDAQRAVRTGLEILAGLQTLNAQLQPTIKARLPHPIQVRIGIHTGLVVIGEIGSSEKREILAMGETPNIAARIQGRAEPDTAVISGATYRLVEGLFECQARGPQELKGISTPLPLYRVVCESAAQSRFEAAVRKGLTPLVGREHEVGLLLERWAQTKQGEGQVVLLSGEAGIGKSRLVQELREQIDTDDAIRIEYRCSPYCQNSALFPIIEHLQHLLQFARADTPEVKLKKLQRTLSSYRFPQADTVPLMAALLSLPHPEGYPPITGSPQKQKKQTQTTLVAWLFEETEKAPVWCIWEDLHWADPSTLEVLQLCLDQLPTVRMLMLLTFRPEFSPPGGVHSYLSQITLNRLDRRQVEEMIQQVTGGKSLPTEVVQQIADKTDGVPIFVEELTKMVLESDLVRPVDGHYELNGPLPPLAIPSTLQDSLMARLDRLATVREIAQLGATIGREFRYDLLQVVSPHDEETLQQGLRQLVEAELIYQRGLLPHAAYFFKHALVQETAYQSLLKSTRQQYHQRIAQVLEGRSVETIETQPELVAHHYTEAGLLEHALPYWQRAGQRAAQQSAHQEAIAHLSKALEVLTLLPALPERTEKELDIQMAIGPAFMAVEGWAAAEVERTYARAYELCHQIGETPKLFPVLYGLRQYYNTRGKGDLAREAGKQLVVLAQRQDDAALLLLAHQALGSTLYLRGEFALARTYLEEAKDFHDDAQHRTLALHYGTAPGVQCLAYGAQVMWFMGYPTQARHRARAAIQLAQRLHHSHSEAMAVYYAARLELLRRDAETAYEQAAAAISFSMEQGFASFRAMGTFVQGWAQVVRGHKHEGLEQILEASRAIAATGNDVGRPLVLGVLAEVHSQAGRLDEGWQCVTEALAAVEESGRRDYEAELHRLKGELVLQSRVQSLESENPSPQPLPPNTQAALQEAEGYFLKAIEIAQRQHAKSLELRAVMSLAKLWRRQGKQKEAHEMLAAVYHWFTEGFDTKDLQETKALLDKLS